MDSSDEESSSDVSNDILLDLVFQIKDWQINHGSLLKLVQSETDSSVLCQPVGVSVSDKDPENWLVSHFIVLQCLPSPFPRARFHEALEIQEIYNRLYSSIAGDPEWIHSTIKDLIPVEPLAKALWTIYEATRDVGYVEDVCVGIFRSDYILHLPSKDMSRSFEALSASTLKQVEFNTFSCAGASHANKVADMHRYLSRTGAYHHSWNIYDGSLPVNKNIESLASCLALAHKTYGPPRSKLARQTAVLFIVQPRNFNIADERPIEYALWNQTEPVPAYRLSFDVDVVEYTRLTENRELLFHPPWLKSQDPVEISVIYMRAGYEASEYNRITWDARVQLEVSTAFKCPSVLSHLTTFKKVQQALTLPGALEHFLSESDAATIRRTFMPIHPLDGSEDGLKAQTLACNSATCTNYILKPSLEGGGHNMYGEAIPGFLASIPKSQWSRYILMERIIPPISKNFLMSAAGLADGEVESELGVLGCCLWRTQASESRCEMLHNSVGGWTFKTKFSGINEMSVAKGYGCFDMPCLVDT